MNAKGEVGAQNVRQLIQLRNTRINREWASDDFPAVLDAFPYPLHFIDFETSNLVIPYHAGMRPYESVAFQWSCHTVEHPGAAPVHGEWINTEARVPARAFAESLRRAIGDGGTVFMWTAAERSTLAQVRAQLSSRGEDDPELVAWIRALEGRLDDMNDLTLKHYFHPRMRGSTSLKVVCEAVWGESPAVRRAFPEYGGEGAAAQNPYHALQPLVVGGKPLVVREGTGAIRAYQAMVYGPESRDPEAHGALRQLLLQYCKLDTAAMVMVWMHWRAGRT